MIHCPTGVINSVCLKTCLTERIEALFCFNFGSFGTFHQSVIEYRILSAKRVDHSQYVVNRPNLYVKELFYRVPF